jgi:hypothetical protein
MGQSLHEFDLRLCRYVLDNIAGHMKDPAFAAYVRRRLNPRVLEHAMALAGAEEPKPLLLNEQELDDLWLEFMTGDFEFDRPWEADRGVHCSSIASVAEVRIGLALQYADEWALASAQFASCLEEPLSLHRGIQTVQAWVGELRLLLSALGATALLPRPEGDFPTPTCPATPAPTTGTVPASRERQAIARMQRAIAVLGPDAKVDDLIRQAEIARKPGRDALRALQDSGDYHGFARARPHRFRQA